MAKFQKGQSGNVNGRPPGVPNKKSQLVQLLDSKSDQIIEKLVEQALNGEPMAMRLCVERLIPRIKDETITLDLPNDLDQSTSVLQAGMHIMQEVSNGRLTPDTGHKLMSILQEQKKILRHVNYQRV